MSGGDEHLEMSASTGYRAAREGNRAAGDQGEARGMPEVACSTVLDPTPRVACQDVGEPNANASSQEPITISASAATSAYWTPRGRET